MLGPVGSEPAGIGGVRPPAQLPPPCRAGTCRGPAGSFQKRPQAPAIGAGACR